MVINKGNTNNVHSSVENPIPAPHQPDVQVGLHADHENSDENQTHTRRYRYEFTK